MSAVHPIFQHIFANMASVGLLPPTEPATVTDLHAERVRREREASERKFTERYGVEFDPDSAA